MDMVLTMVMVMEMTNTTKIDKIYDIIMYRIL